jgi:hypothetical protein
MNLSSKICYALDCKACGAYAINGPGYVDRQNDVAFNHGESQRAIRRANYSAMSAVEANAEAHKHGDRLAVQPAVKPVVTPSNRAGRTANPLMTIGAPPTRPAGPEPQVSRGPTLSENLAEKDRAERRQRDYYQQQHNRDAHHSSARAHSQGGSNKPAQISSRYQGNNPRPQQGRPNGGYQRTTPYIGNSGYGQRNSHRESRQDSQGGRGEQTSSRSDTKMPEVTLKDKKKDKKAKKALMKISVNQLDEIGASKTSPTIDVDPTLFRPHTDPESPIYSESDEPDSRMVASTTSSAKSDLKTKVATELREKALKSTQQAKLKKVDASKKAELPFSTNGTSLGGVLTSPGENDAISGGLLKSTGVKTSKIAHMENSSARVKSLPEMIIKMEKQIIAYKNLEEKRIQELNKQDLDNIKRGEDEEKRTKDINKLRKELEDIQERCDGLGKDLNMIEGVQRLAKRRKLNADQAGVGNSTTSTIEPTTTIPMVQSAVVDLLSTMNDVNAIMLPDRIIVNSDGKENRKYTWGEDAGDDDDFDYNPNLAFKSTIKGSVDKMQDGTEDTGEVCDETGIISIDSNGKDEKSNSEDREQKGNYNGKEELGTSNGKEELIISNGKEEQRTYNGKEKLITSNGKEEQSNSSDKKQKSDLNGKEEKSDSSGKEEKKEEE